MRLHIENMTCGGCVKSVTRAIQSVDPKAEVSADLNDHMVEVATTAPRDRVVAVLADAGYTAA